MKKKILIILIIAFALFLCFKYDLFSTTSEYRTIAQAVNNNYSGIGQENIKGKDGYFTTFTTIEDNKKTYIEYKQNGNSSWSNKQYWGGTMEENGCGITAIATILSGYNKNYTPEELRPWNKPNNNRWTISSHYMVLLATDNEDMVYISNPNGGENDSKSSGWYNFNEVTPYIAKALYIES